MRKFRLLKEIHHPFGNYQVGECRDLYSWLEEFGVDWLSYFEDRVENNPEWFKEENE